jgi:signal transduction histidine kinase
VRRQLILTVAAVISMVLLALLVPMAVLVRNYALEDRLSRAALEVQATETVVSRRDKGEVSVYLDRLNRGDGTVSTAVLYADGVVIGPGPGDDDLVRTSRATGRARVDDVAGGIQILVPVSLGGSDSTGRSPVVRVLVRDSSVAGEVHRAWLVLGGLGVAMLIGAVVLADRLGRSFVRPIAALADSADHLGDNPVGSRTPVAGPPEVRTAARALNRLVDRVEVLLDRERQQAIDLSHRLRTPITALRLTIDGLDDPQERVRLTGDVDALEEAVDRLLLGAHRSFGEGLVSQCDAVDVVQVRTHFWSALADEQQRDFRVELPAGPIMVRVTATDMEALVDVLLDNVFTHTPEGAAVAVTVTPDPQGGATLSVDDGGPGLPPELDVVRRGASGAGSSGLGLAIAVRTARESGGDLETSPSRLGGARVSARLGPADG